MKLKELQENFANHIYNKKDSKIFPIINSKKISVDKRLDIYRNNIFGSFDDCLEMTYKITKKIVGDDYFSYLCDEYKKQYKSDSGNLEDYGEFFPQLIKELEKKHKLAYLSDIANLEWRFNLAYFSKDITDIDLEKLQSLNEEEFMQLEFCLNPSCHLIASNYPIYSIWQQNIKRNSKEINIEEKKGEFIIISRPDFKVKILQLSKVEFDFLNMIKNQQNLYEIYQTITKKEKFFDIGSIINKFISLRVITNFKTKNA